MSKINIELSYETIDQIVTNFKNTLLHYEELLKKDPNNKEAQIIKANRTKAFKEFLDQVLLMGYTATDSEVIALGKLCTE